MSDELSDGTIGAPPSPDSPANRLRFEKSPYLLQHAKNPVNWYPWGDEAFVRAYREDKPVFLSIGYATCHWCHVMAHESFEDADVAKILNDSFICVKVDREERPDIDGVYMQVSQIMTGSGGWPLTIIMAPDRRPFFAATYIPKKGRFGLKGMLDLMPEISRLWKERRRDLLKRAEQVKNTLSYASAPGNPVVPDDTVLTSAYEDLVMRFDHEHGGFGNAPKFPAPHNLLFLLRYWNRTKNPQALEMVTKTLDEIRKGGIYDQIGFGIHRYATDEEWKVPHFEKMLYDQALLAMAYTETYQATGCRRYRQVAEEILSYILRDMTSPDGAFYSAEDADSESREGAFYLWKTEDIEQVLSREDAAIASSVYNLTPAGNYRDHEGISRNNILHRTESFEELAGKFSMGQDELIQRLGIVCKTLFSARQERPRPLRDDKVLADWNGLAIAAFAKAAAAFGDPGYARAAERASRFVLTTMQNPDGGLFHRYRDGESAIPAFADDYAGMIWGLFELYEATFDDSILVAAIALNRFFLDHFWDGTHGGFFSTSDRSEQLLIRKKEIYDGASPSGNSLGLLNLVRIARATGDPYFEDKADSLSRFFGGMVRSTPAAHTSFLCSLDYALGPSHEVVVTGDLEHEGSKELIDACRAHFLPSVVIIHQSGQTPGVSSPAMTPQSGLHPEIDGLPTAYVCSRHACHPPTHDAGTLLALLGVKKEDRIPVPQPGTY